MSSAYGLTPSETRLTLVLLAGDSLRVAAKKLGVQYETARTTLKRVFHKTGARRQAELVLLLTRGTRAQPFSRGKDASRNKRRQGS